MSEETKINKWLWKTPPPRSRIAKDNPLARFLENPFVDEEEEIVELFVPRLKPATHRYHKYQLEFIEHTAASLGWSISLFMRELVDLYMTSTGYTPEVDKYEQRVTTVKELRKSQRFKKRAPSQNKEKQEELAAERAIRHEQMKAVIQDRQRKREERNAKRRAEYHAKKEEAKSKGRAPDQLVDPAKGSTKSKPKEKGDQGAEENGDS